MGIIIRIVLMPITAHPFDVYAWYTIATGHDGSIQYFPPFWFHYMLTPLSFFYNWLAEIFPTGTVAMSTLPSALNFYPDYNILLVPGLLFNFIVKIPFLLSDVIIAWLLYKLVNEITGNKGYAETAAIFWFLNPIVIWISAGWGMWDTLPALFSLASAYFLVKRKVVFSAVCLAVGIALKIYPLLFLVPFIFFLFRTTSKDQRIKNILIFNAALTVTSIFLFLPYLSSVPQYLVNLIAPTIEGVANGMENPVVNPLGFGLTYWSIGLMGRLFSNTVSIELVSMLSIVSIILVSLFLGFSYWKISKCSFKNSFSDLSTAMILVLFAFFLSNRVVCEQWTIWAIPFLILLYSVRKIKKSYFWSLSLIALLYVFLNCPLPFFFLPIVPWAENSLLILANASLSFEPFRISLLAILGSIFSLIIIRCLLDIIPLSSKNLFRKPCNNP